MRETTQTCLSITQVTPVQLLLKPVNFVGDLRKNNSFQYSSRQYSNAPLRSSPIKKNLKKSHIIGWHIGICRSPEGTKKYLL